MGRQPVAEVHLKKLTVSYTGLSNRAGTNATGAHGDSMHTAVGRLMTYLLQIRINASFGFDIGMAYTVADLGSFAAYFTLSGHF
jgi:hypothetical protein